MCVVFWLIYWRGGRLEKKCRVSKNSIFFHFWGHFISELSQLLLGLVAWFVCVCEMGGRGSLCFPLINLCTSRNDVRRLRAIYSRKFKVVETSLLLKKGFLDANYVHRGIDFGANISAIFSFFLHSFFYTEL